MSLSRITLIGLAAVGVWTLISFITAPFIGRFLADQLETEGQQPTPVPDPKFFDDLWDRWAAELADKDVQ